MNRFTVLVLLLMMGFVLAASLQAEEKKEPQTQTQPQSQDSQQTQTGVTVTYEDIQRGTFSGMKDAMAQVIKNKKDFEDLWKKHVSLLVPQPPVPQIDFSTSV